MGKLVRNLAAEELASELGLNLRKAYGVAVGDSVLSVTVSRDMLPKGPAWHVSATMIDDCGKQSVPSNDVMPEVYKVFPVPLEQFEEPMESEGMLHWWEKV